MRPITWLLLMAGAGLAGCASNDDASDDDGTVPAVYDPTCAALGLDGYATRLEDPVTGTYALDGTLGGVNTVILGTDGVHLAFGTSIPVDAVIVKGGPSANVYQYPGEETFDLGLVPPINPMTLQPYAISHVDLCFDYEVAVTLEVGAAFKRAFTWSIDKSSPVTEVVMAPAQVLRVPFTVDATLTGFTDGDWTVGGKVIIDNPSPFPANITGIQVVLGSIRAEMNAAPPHLPVICPAVPFQLAPGAMVECAYELKAPDAMVGNVVATVTTAGEVGAAIASAPFDFATATVTPIDACVDVRDDSIGARGATGELGRTCKSQRFTYTLDLGPFSRCGRELIVTNLASLITPDSRQTLTAAWNIDVTIPECPPGGPTVSADHR